jgi:hypothetical protein
MHGSNSWTGGRMRICFASCSSSVAFVALRTFQGYPGPFTK